MAACNRYPSIASHFGRAYNEPRDLYILTQPGKTSDTSAHPRPQKLKVSNMSPIIKYPQVVLLGDSLLQQSAEIRNGFSFQGALQNHVIRRLDVVNRGFSGWNTANVLKYLPELFSPPSETTPKVDYLIVLLGANDAVRPLPAFAQHVPQEEYRANLTAIITHPIIAAHNPKILLVTPPPVDEIHLESWDLVKGWPEITRYAKLSAEYSQIAREVAAATPGVVSIDLWQAVHDEAAKRTPGWTATDGKLLGTFESGQRGALEQLLPDGLHMNGEAYEVFFKAVVPHIGSEWANLPADDRSGYLLPDWKTFGSKP
ncbi:GDSL Lipase/Acylhydrolase family protein [Plectosphaerella plurivora]|uniref:GDSL Lipase/Acylhydrolase family protein n=1 Tax=Plectosphaerella plurivora TaxID=936078 RepID=A0A9P8V4G3_9PEZI|nr:GDSL Lipase/Acylhydrolase family protein [Plectosphaerella plurivora]